MVQAQYQLDLPQHTVDSAPEGVQGTLQGLQDQMGLLPNIFGYLANAPALLHGYLDLDRRFREETRLSAVEQEVVLLTISRENGCGYCMAVHSHAADRIAGVPSPVTDALRAREPLPDSRLDALSRFTQRLFATRGLPERSEVEAFHRAGYDDLSILEIILALGLKSLSNYTNHLCHTELDAPFRGRAWRDPGAR
ncbi:MAG: carboxymuconolactone decarboxylase family protein [Halorhodospira sp.]